MCVRVRVCVRVCARAVYAVCVVCAVCMCVWGREGALTKRRVHRHLNRGHEWVAVAPLLPSTVSI